MSFTIGMSSRYTLITTLLIIPCWATLHESGDGREIKTDSLDHQKHHNIDPVTLRPSSDQTTEKDLKLLLIKQMLEKNPTLATMGLVEDRYAFIPMGTTIPSISKNTLTKQKTCGQRKFKGIEKILGTPLSQEVAEFGEFPWMVAIITVEDFPKFGIERNEYQCGGALVHPQIVLTAAHCVQFFKENPSILKVRAGEWDTETTTEILPHQDRLVRNIIIHEGYHKGGLHNDYGLLILSQPVDLRSDNVGIVCLPEANENFDHSLCIASGWGKDQYGKPNRSSILKRVELPVVPHNQCQDALKSTRLGDIFEFHNSFICAGGEPGKDTCKGDGGSPLVCPMKENPNKFVQSGIVSWGINCGLSGIPGVYASVAAGRHWINDQATKVGFNINEYQIV